MEPPKIELPEMESPSDPNEAKKFDKTKVHVEENTDGETTDKGWAWVVAAACLVNVFLSGGMFKIFGMIIVEVTETFDTPASEANLLLSTFWVSFCVVSFLINFALGHIFNERVLVIFAGIAGAIGMIASFFATRAEHIIHPLGICSGMNMTLGVGGSLAILGSHFKARLSLANSITMSGAAFATFILPPLVRYLLDEYRLQGTLLILGGLTLNMLVGGTLLRPAKVKVVGKHSTSHNPSCMVSEHGQIPAIFRNINECKGYGGVDGHDQLWVGIAAKRTKIIGLKKFFFKETGRRTSLRNLFAIELLKKPIFIAYQLFCLVSVIGCNLLVQFLPSNAKDLGFQGYQTAALLSILGVSDLLGRIINGVLGDCGFMERYKILMISQFVLGSSAILSIFALTFWPQAVFSAVVGIQIGLYFSCLSVVMVDFFGAKSLCKAQGVNQLAQGFGMLIGISTTGYLRELSGSYGIAFIVIGSLSICAGAILLGVAIIHRFKTPKTTAPQEERPNDGMVAPETTRL